MKPKLLMPHKDRLFGLTIVPDRLRQIRSERRPNSRYASLARCRKEVADAESIFTKEGIRFIDTSGSSIEEPRRSCNRPGLRGGLIERCVGPMCVSGKSCRG